MKLDPKIEARGLRAYEQAAAFEELRTWKLPLSYAIFPLAPVLTGGVMWKLGHAGWAAAHLLFAALLVIGAWYHWRGLKIRYARNLALLADLERTHGDALPWVQIEKHFAALERLKQDLAEEKIVETLKAVKRDLEE